MSRIHEPLTESLLDGRFPFDDPFGLYASLRETNPVAWCEDPGFWAVSRHEDVLAVSSDTATFSSGSGILLSEIGTTYESPPTMMHTDPPAHTAYRSLVQPPFSRRSVGELRAAIEQRAADLIDGLPLGEPFDLVERLSVPLPIQVIADLLGLAESEWDRIFLWSEAAIPGAADFTEDEQLTLMGEMTAHLMSVSASRRSDPGADLISVLAHAEMEGRSLDDAELAMFMIQLLVAGNETTRNMLSGGLVALAERPDQWDRLRAGAPESLAPAIEELLRWTTPVISFMRTATVDTQLGHQEISAGDRVLMLYASANRDEDAFGSTAAELDVERSPNHHVSFGFGAHFCLGARLARLEAEVVLNALLQRGLRPSSARSVVRSPSSVIAGVKSAELVFESEAA